MRNVFLDANILLDFFRFGQDDIAEIGKLVTLCKDQELRLLCNEHLMNEVLRNREKELSDSFSELKSKNFAIKTPNYCQQFAELEDLRETLKAANKAHGELVSAVQKAIEKREIGADQLLRDLWAISHNLPVDNSVVVAARERVELGNPPGKRNSIGDAIHWESLLAEKKIGLYFVDIVSRDGDFTSTLNSNAVKDMLAFEWTEAKGKHAEITIFRSLSDYFKSRFPQIKLSDEAMKGELIDQLIDSPNFSTTHDIIAKLDKHEFFTVGQALRLFDALVQNNQVGWIATDDDVSKFFTEKLKDKAWNMPEQVAVEAAQLLEIDKEKFFDAIPF